MVSACCDSCCSQKVKQINLFAENPTEIKKKKSSISDSDISLYTCYLKKPFIDSEAKLVRTRSKPHKVCQIAGMNSSSNAT